LDSSMASPTAWNIDDLSSHLSVDPSGIRVNYIGIVYINFDTFLRALFPQQPLSTENFLANVF
ncbi:21495_t:CDS:1, partial [Gigaspora rosea]